MPLKTNTFWVAANFTIDLDTGKTTRILTTANHQSDAAEFHAQQDAQKFYDFVRARIPEVQWFIDPPTPQKPWFVIRGTQTINIP